MKTTTKLGALLAVLLAFSLLLPACGAAATPTTTAAVQPTKAAAATVAPAATPTAVKPQPKTGGTLSYAMSADGTNGHYDTAMFRDRSVAFWWGGIYESLLAHDMDTFAVVPRLAEKWSLSADAKTVTLQLRQGVKWHNVPPVNGREFTSADVKWNIERIRDQKTAGQWTAALKVFTSIETPDKYTVKLTMTDPYAPIISTLADASLMMYPKELFDSYGEMQKTAAIGTGPFMFKSYQPEVALKMVKNPDYYIKGVPRVDGVDINVIKDASARLAALRTGQIAFLGSLTVSDRDSLKMSNPDMQFFPHIGFAYTIRVNVNKPPLDNVKVRKALELAINRQEIIKLALQGAGELQGVYMPDVEPAGVLRTQDEMAKWPGYRVPKDADIAEAKKLLQEAGYAGGLTIESFAYSGQPELVSANEIIRAQLAPLGITWNIRLGDYATVGNATKTSGDYQVALWYVRAGDADVLYGNHYSKSAANIMGWGSAALDKLLDAGRMEPEAVKRAQIYRDIEEKIVLEMCTEIPLFRVQSFFGVRPEWRELKPMFGTTFVFFGETFRHAWMDK